MGWLAMHLERNPVPPPFEYPTRYKDADVAGIENEALRKLSIKYLTHFEENVDAGIGILLLGKAQTWKTYTALTIAKRAYERGKLDCMFMGCASELLSLGQNQYSDYTRARIDQAKKVSMLVMDDFAMVPSHGAAFEMLLGIATYRFDNLRPTLWTANILENVNEELMEAIGRSYGPGFARRLYDSSEGYRKRVA